MSDYVPELAALPAWAPVTLEHVLDMATGVDLEEHYENPDSMYWRYAYAVGYYAGDSAASGSTLGFVTSELTRAAEQAERGWAKDHAVMLYREALGLVPEDATEQRSALRRRLAIASTASFHLDDVRRPGSPPA